MPDLVHSLQPYDVGHLRIVAGLWGVELVSSDADGILEELAAALLNPQLASEVIESLSAEARSAIALFATAGGKIPWAIFTRRFGEIREAGPGRRDREQIYLDPISTAEILFYRALLARAFFDTPSGAQEFAYMPEDLVELIKREGLEISLPSPSLPAGEGRGMGKGPLGRLAVPREHVRLIPACDRLLDDATTLLAALRMGRQPPETQVPVKVVGEFLRAAGIMVGEASQPEKVKSFLEMPRQQALDLLRKTWQESKEFNELHLVPAFVCEGEWENSPLVTRHALLNFLADIPKDRWWSLPSFILAVREGHPDFQRPVGDYDSWFIRRLSDGQYLRGFESWDEVEGALIRYLISGPLFWLGMVSLATPADSEVITAFRLNGKQVGGDEKGKLAVSSNGRISVSRAIPRVARYLISRFCEWDDEMPEEYRYHVSTRSLKHAQEQGLKVGQLLSLLAKNAAAEIPPAFIKALKRWEMNGTEARVEAPVVLRVSSPKVLEELRKSKAGRFLGESLGPAVAIIKPGAQSKVLAALAEMGLLAEDETGDNG